MSKLEGRLLFLFSAYSLMMLYICTKFHEEISEVIDQIQNITINLNLSCDLDFHQTGFSYVLHITLV